MAELFKKGIAPTTERSYRTGRKKYVKFCEKYSRPPLPVSESGLCQFVACLAGEGLTHGSVKAYLAAVRQMQVEAGLGNPGMDAMAKLKQVIRGVQRLRAEQGQQQRRRKPMTVQVLEVLRRSWSVAPGGLDAKMLWAAATLSFFGFMRSGEVTVPSTRAYDPSRHLSWQDVSTDSVANPTVVRVTLKISKTDQVRQGCTVIVGCTGDKLCPVTAVLGYMGEAGCRQGPLFQYSSGKPLTQAGFVVEVKTALERGAMCSEGFSGHSFRIGAATTAAEVGVGDAVIQQLGRWKSAAYKGYVQPDRGKLAGVPRLLAGSSAGMMSKLRARS